MPMSPFVVLMVVAVPWAAGPNSQTLEERLPPPPGYARVAQAADSFGHWLRQLPVKPGQPAVRLYDGSRKLNQSAQWLVLDIDVGRRNLQQCADAVMRLFAEWQWVSGQRSKICFRYTSGHKASWSGWSKGDRAKVKGRRVEFVRRAAPSSDYASFRRYLDSVFIYAGSASLSRDLKKVRDPKTLRPGDVFIKGGYPGHAVIVVDVVENAAGERRFALAQSYMPAQQIHVLRNPRGQGAWYPIRPEIRLKTPEWTFSWSELARFRDTGCP